LDDRPQYAAPTTASPARFAVCLVLTGAGAGVGGAALTLLLHAVQHAAFGYTEDTFLIGVQHASAERRVIVMSFAGLVAGGGWWALRRYGAPIPRIPDALNSRKVRLPLVWVTLDAALQIIVVALGASLGREGAPRQFGAAIGAWLSNRSGLSLQQRKIVLASGAGAGLAAVYNVPIGGALFTLEVLLVSIALPAVVSAFVASSLATLIAWAVLPNRPAYVVFPVSTTGTVLVWALVAAPLMGATGVIFVRLTRWAGNHRPTGWRLPISTFVVFTAIGLLAVPYPQLLGNGKGPAQLAFDGTLPWSTLVALLLLKPIVTAACLRSGATGGRLTPAVATGALLGAVTGKAWLLLWPGSRIAEFAIVAAAGFLAVTLSAPITAIALIVEFTDTGADLLVPMVLAVVISTVTARAIDKSMSTRNIRTSVRI
jgi:H+/Cl- antiporter ClcA